MRPSPASPSEFIWTPRRQVALSNIQRRSSLVRFLRMAFTAGAAISVGLLAGPVIANAISGLSDQRRSFGSDEIVTMINPRFTGRDAGGEPYVITAETAQRRRASDNLIDLRSPNLVDQKGTRITAPEGTFNQRDQTLELRRDVQVHDSAGYTFRTTSALFHITEGRIEGLEPLYGVGPLGDIRSDAYEITDDGSVITFRGNVEMVFDPAPGPAVTGSDATDTPTTVENDGENG